jgi:hypothetical protein
MKSTCFAYILEPASGTSAADALAITDAVDSRVSQLGFTEARLYCDKTAANKRRPGLDRMVAALRAGDVVVIWSVASLGRSTGGNIQRLLAIHAAGARVVSVQEPRLELEGAVVEVFKWVVAMEREYLTNRTRLGMAAAKERNGGWGRKCAGMIPPGERRAAVEQWEAEGRPDGVKGLAFLLGCKSHVTAWKMHRLWLARDARPQDTEYDLPTGSQKTEMIQAAPMVVL